MRNAETVLGIIQDRGRRGLPLEDVYRQLFNPELFLLPMVGSPAMPGAMTPGVTAETADGMSLAKIGRIIDALRREALPVDASAARLHREERLDEETPARHPNLVGQAAARGDAPHS